MRDIANNIAGRESVRPAVHSASVSGEIVDLRGFDSAAAVINTGAIGGSGNFTPKLVHGNESDLGDGEDVGADDLIGSFASALAANSVYVVGYRVRKRYVRVVLTKNSGTSIAAGAVLMIDQAQQRAVA